jgi:phage shock protein A
MPKRQHRASLRYVLSPDRSAADDIEATMSAYGRMMLILDTIAAAQGGRANLVRLHAEAYERLRRETGLPSRLVTLGMRDHSHLAPGQRVTSLPLDEKLFSIKGPDTVSLATRSGRHLIQYRVEGYSAGWTDFAPARLHVEDGRIEVRVGVDIEAKEGPMAQEGILGRMGRIVSGATNAVIDSIEGRASEVVVEQALRDIDRATDAARVEYGRHQAEAHRIEAGIASKRREAADLEGKVRAALDAGRAELARPVVARQIDLESQIEALEVALAEAKANVAEGARGLAAVKASRDDVERRLAELRKAAQASEAPSAKGRAAGGAADRAADALRAVERVTGVPAAPEVGAAEIAEIERIQRDRLIDERLASLRDKG